MAWIIGGGIFFALIGGVPGLLVWAFIILCGIIAGGAQVAGDVAVHGFDGAQKKWEAESPEAQAIEAEA